MNAPKAKRPRRRYSKPMIQEVQLRLNEAVLANACKAVTSTTSEGIEIGAGMVGCAFFGQCFADDGS